MNDSLKHWRSETDADDIVWLHFDKADAGTNVLSAEVFAELDTLLGEIAQHNPRGLVILSDKDSGFIAGADVKEFTTLGNFDNALQLIRRGQAVLDRIAGLPFPTLALIHGFCLGGGTELALACRYRIADDDAKTRIGLPEVRLGIHPGFGGSVRLPPLIGAPAAFDVMLSGRSLSARAAQKIGLIDYAVPKRQLLRAARAMMLDPPRVKRATGWKAWTNSVFVRPLLAPVLRRQVAKRARPDHYPAPYALIDLWRQHGDNPAVMLEEEAHSVAELIMGNTAQNLVRVFMLQEQLKALGKDKTYAPRHVHVIGAGIMGGDIAAWCALRGMQVTLQDRSNESLAPAMKRAFGLFKAKLKLPRLITSAMDRLQADVEGRGVVGADVVIEAIFENVEAKRQLFQDIEPRMKPDALLATNTSSIPLQDLATVLRNPGRLVGLHFFNPVAKMQLVEIVSSPDTDASVAARAAAFTRKIDRLPLPVTSTPGFLVNRILMPYLLEAVILHSEGIPAPVIDKIALEFGMPMGPLLLADTVGLDICLSVADILGQHADVAIPDRLRQWVSEGRLGVKSGRGFYEYKQGKQIKQSIDNSYLPPIDVGDRLMLRMLNEAVACLRESVVSDADLLDAGVIFGTGFAPFRGGPMQHIRSQGSQGLRQRLHGLERSHGKRFAADPGWEGLDERLAGMQANSRAS